IRWPFIHAGVACPVTKFDEVRAQSPDHAWQVAWMLDLAHGFGVNPPFRATDLLRATANGRSPGSAQRTEMLNAYLGDHITRGRKAGGTSVRSVACWPGCLGARPRSW
ncbi:MAG: hypothetical protein JJ992_04110, partial [Planctomycetes bacterium]|nr:hypothetical protein [Planctomycetota bacterium]